MNNFEGNAILYCEGAHNAPNSKTEDYLMRFTQRYNVLSIFDSSYVGKDAAIFLETTNQQIPIFANLNEAFLNASEHNQKIEFAVIGLLTENKYNTEQTKIFVKNAIKSGLHVDSEIHDFLMDDDNIIRLAVSFGVKIRDIRKIKI